MFSASKTKQAANNAPSNITLTKSLRFRSSASAYLSRTMSSSSSTYTISTWVKRGSLDTYQYIFSSGPDTAGSDKGLAYTLGTGTIYVYNGTTSVASSAIYKDVSAWYHIVMSVNAQSATVYINNVNVGITQTSMTLGTYGRIGGFNSVYPNPFDGYLADFYLIDGQALTPSSFGATNATTGVWQPIAYSGSYGTAGFHLTFANTTSTTTLGYDTSGNSNNWTTNNISLTAGSTYDSMNDVPTLTSATASNYPVLNPATQSAGTISNGNLQYYGPNSWKSIASTILLPNTGKWYAEVVLLNAPLSSNFADVWNVFGFIAPSALSAWSYNTGTSFYIGDVGYYSNYSTGGSGNFTGNTTGTVLGLAFDRSTNQITIYQNGVSKVTVTIGITSGSDLYFFNGSYSATYGSMAYNFGQQPFVYTPPSGYVALNT
jgi:hypothetical protein